ncbi:hypothetical protein, partial [Bacteroides sp.]|uniref:hypothetical protein n=1 Tax=Bacteroides sp. TaxID=29523 RepID=UPI0023CAA50D
MRRQTQVSVKPGNIGGISLYPIHTATAIRFYLMTTRQPICSHIREIMKPKEKEGVDSRLTHPPSSIY